MSGLVNFAVLDPNSPWHSTNELRLPPLLESKFNHISLGAGYFNGDRYADAVRTLTQYSLYDDLSSEDLIEVYQDLEGTHNDKLRSFFKVCIENNLGLIASISP